VVTEEDGEIIPLQLHVADESAGERLDRYLTTVLEDISRSEIKRWIEGGRVLVDGETASPKHKMRAGSVLVVTPAPPPVSDAIPQKMPLEFLYEDEHLVVVNKPSGLVVHPAPGHPDGTLVNGLLFHFGEASTGQGTRPGIVHRLDKDTSGLMVVARTAFTHQALVSLFQARDIERAYQALVAGRPRASLVLDTLHGRHPGDRKRFSTKVDRGKRAITEMKVIENLHACASVECRLRTGRTHQIRVHLADIGHPVIGDKLYGRAPRDPVVRAAWNDLGRQALHAKVLGFQHPVTGESMRFEVEPPEDYQRCEAALAVVV